MVAYQSNLLGAEVDPALAASTPGNVPIDAVNEARLYSLNGFSLRRGAGLPDALVESILEANAEISFSGSRDGGTEVTIISPEGGLAWISRVALAAPGEARRATSGRAVSSPRRAQMRHVHLPDPASSSSGIRDVTIFLSATPDVAA